MRLERRNLARLLAPLVVLAILLTACNQGMPDQSGEYQLKLPITWDGDRYEFGWVDKAGAIQRASGDDVQLVQDSRAYLEMKDGRPIVHLAPEDPVTVLGRDRNGDFSSSWFPFMAGMMLGGRDRTVVINQPYPGTSQVPPDRPAYRYPPTDSFGRGDTIQGSVTNSRASAPDYSRIRPIPDAVSGQSGGAGGGSATSGKSPSITSGQAGGAGSASAASTKGSFRASGQSGGTGVGSAASSKGISGSGSKPSTGISGGKSSGGFSGGKSGGVRIGGGRR